MSKKIAAEKGKRMAFRYGWGQLLIIPFSMKENVQEAMAQVERWLREEEGEWCDDDDLAVNDNEDAGDGDVDSGSDQASPSYLIIGCYQSRIQGPVVYVLVAGASDDLDTSVEEWNKRREEKCVRIRFQDFGELKIRRRTGMLTFLHGLFDVGCLCQARVYKAHRLSERELRAQNAEF
jgi:hypothetical protein